MMGVSAKLPGPGAHCAPLYTETFCFQWSLTRATLFRSQNTGARKIWRSHLVQPSIYGFLKSFQHSPSPHTNIGSAHFTCVLPVIFSWLICSILYIRLPWERRSSGIITLYSWLHVYFADFFLFLSFFFFFCNERKHERGRQNLKQAPCSVWRPTQGSIPWPWDRDPSRNQESDIQLTEPSSASALQISK